MQEFANQHESTVQSFLAMCCWKEMVENAEFARKEVNHIAKVSDKAFVMLVLENIVNDMMTISIEDYYRPKKRKKTNNNKNSEGSKNADSPSEPITNDKKCAGKYVITGQWTIAWHGSC